jgi:deazaflavin-dependent oxidoreductase (nitroreductase family)
MASDLAAWGRIVVVETRGRRTGRRRRAPVGFVEGPDGSLLVAAGDERTGWALNLMADSRCTVEREGRAVPHRAIPLDEVAHREVVTALILKYGAPAERLGRGPAFRLVPLLPGREAPTTS